MPKTKEQESKTKIMELSQSGSDFLNFAFCILLFAFLAAGCEPKRDSDVDVLALGPDTETIFVPSDYAARAMEATGGLTAWTKTKKLRLDCVVTFYQPDGSFYLTEQRYDVYPWSNAIRISAVEPQGRFLWQLTKGHFNALEGGEQLDGLPVAVGSRCLAEATLNIITAPIRFLDESVEFTKQTTAEVISNIITPPGRSLDERVEFGKQTPTVRIQGQWYHPIDRTSKPDVEPAERLSDAVFYQNRDTFLLDMLWFGGMNGEKSLMVRGYDYRDVEKGGVWVPAKIEIFRTDARGNVQERLVKIDCHTLRPAK